MINQRVQKLEEIHEELARRICACECCKDDHGKLEALEGRVAALEALHAEPEPNPEPFPHGDI
jgi:hypothetical protein